MYQNNEWTTLNKEVEPVEPVQMDIYQSNTYRKDLSWPHFASWPGVQERQQVKDQQNCISVSVANLAIPSGYQEHEPRHDNSIPYMVVWQLQRYRATSEERNFIERIKTPIFLEAVLEIEAMYNPPIQFRRENQPKHPKR